MSSNRKLEYQHFDLQKIKQNPDGLELNYHEKGGTTIEHTIKAEGQPHPDFTAALEAFKLYFAKRIGILKGWDFARENCKDDLDKLKEAIAGHDEAVESVKVSGIVFTGQDQLRAVKITGSVKCDPGSYGMATPNITFSSEKLGYEKIVEELCETLRGETYNYFFKNKRAQQDLYDQAEQQDEQQEDAAFKLK